MTMTAVLLILPHQLFAQLPLQPAETRIVLAEEALLFRQYAFHKQKLAFHRATMQYYRQHLLEQGWQVEYIDCTDARSDVRELLPSLAVAGVTTLHVPDPVDDWMTRRIVATAAASGMTLQWHPGSLFMLHEEELGRYFSTKRKRYLHETFYRARRRELGILLDAQGNPDGGKWSFDSDNRKPFPRQQLPPMLPSAPGTPYHAEALAWVERHFPDNPGFIDGGLTLPVTHTSARSWLDEFLHQRLAGFGTFEDAIVGKAPVLYHSVLTPLLNCGLLTPSEVVTRALAHAHEYNVPLNDIEGFTRQVIGWREFIRGLYVFHGRQQRTANYWGFANRPLPAAFYSASTGLDPVDHVIRRVLQYGYCHHIERLMVLGCIMLLCECHPDAVYQWFMEMFIDAFDWVMVPNVYGMSQFADGGLMATKPYICGSAYILRMSDFKRGEWCYTWDALFWRFMHRHADRLSGNPRLGMLLKQFRKRPDSEQAGLLSHAEAWLEKLQRPEIPNAR
jgi:deoxyribodipyrimidine photolyase-related protein